MENNINVKKGNFNMMKIFNTFFMVFVLMFSANAVAQNEILQYHFEENGGSIIFDTSGFNNHGTRNGGRWQTSASQFGTYGFDFDGGNDWIDSINPQAIPDTMTVSYWFKLDDNSNDLHWTMYDGTDKIEIKLDPDGGANYEIKYFDSVQATQTVKIDLNSFNTGQWYNVIFSFDFLNDTMYYYRDSVLQSNISIPDLNRQSATNVLRLGATQTEGSDYNGDIDEFRIFDFLTNQTQVNSLYTLNTIALDSGDNGDGDGNGDTNQTVYSDIINLISGNYTGINPIDISITTLESATCELYIDNSLVETYTDILAFSYDDILELGEHTYFVYCEVIDLLTSTKTIDISETYTLTVTQIPSTINFQIEATDYSLNDVQLYITSPCLERGIGNRYVDIQPFQTQFNPGGAYFRKVVDGYASLTLIPGTHEFCLFNGLIDYDSFNKTSNYHIGEYLGVLNLGDFDVPNNITTTFAIKTDEFDVYEKVNPKAWGQTWKSIITGLILFLIGLIVLLSGNRNGNNTATLIGGLMIILALGFEINGLFGILVGV